MGCSPCKSNHNQIINTKIKPKLWYRNEFNYWYQIFDYLEFRELLEIAVVCKSFHTHTAHYSLLLKFRQQPTKLDTLAAGNAEQDSVVDTEIVFNSTPRFRSTLNISNKSSDMKWKERIEMMSYRADRSKGDETLNSLLNLSSFKPFGVMNVCEEYDFMSEGSFRRDIWTDSIDFRMNREACTWTDVSTNDSKQDILHDASQIHKKLWQSARQLDISGFTHYLEMLDSQYRASDFLDFTYGNGRTSLLALAACSGDASFLSLLLEKLPNLSLDKGYRTRYQELNSVYIFKLSPLQLACARGLYKIVKLLLNHNCSLTSYGYSQSQTKNIITHIDLGMPPVIICTSPKYRSAYLKILDFTYEIGYSDDEVNYTECLRLICEKGADVNVEIDDEEYPRAIFHAITHPGMMKILIENGAELNVTNAKGFTPLYVLCERCDNVNTGRMMVEKGANVNPESCRPIYVAVNNRRMNLAMFLKESGACINGSENTPSILQVAISINDPYMCKCILLWKDLRIDWTYRQVGKNMFHRIAHNKGYEIFNALTNSRRSDPIKIKEALNSSTLTVPSKGDTTPLYYALPDISLVQLMIQKGADIHRLNFARCFSQYYSDKLVIKFLLSKKCNLGDRFEGKTAIWMAYEKGSVEYLNLLTRYGGNINSLNDEEMAPIHDACLKGLIDIVETLLKLGASLELTSGIGKNAEYYCEGFYPTKSIETVNLVMKVITKYKCNINK